MLQQNTEVRQRKKKETKMAAGNNSATNADLAGLGLDIGSLDTSDSAIDNALAPAKQETAPVVTPSADAATATPQTEGADVANKKGTREQVNIGSLEIEEDVELAPMTRTRGANGESRSKYKFNELRAPVRKDDGSYSYASFLATPGEGTDDAALKRSVQSATTQENAKHKGKSEGFEAKDIYYVTRAVNKDGKFVGIRVYRVDGTTKD